MTKIFFDFDGVLVQSRFSNKTFLWQKDIECDLKVPTAVLNILFQQPQWNEILSGKSDFKQKIEEVFRQNGLSTTADEFINYWLSHDLNWRGDVLAIATKLKRAGHSLYIATNQDRIRSHHIGKQKEVISLFDGIFSSCDLGMTKPNPAFYSQIQEQKFSGQNGAFLLIDDDRRNLEAASDVGWRGFYFNPDLDQTHSAENLERALPMALT